MTTPKLRLGHVDRRVDAERELGAMIDAALAKVSAITPATALEELRGDVLRLAQQHAARVVHGSVLARTEARGHFPRRRR